MLEQPSLTALRATATTVHVIAISCSALRLCYRRYRGRTWWDDVWTAIAMCFDLLLEIELWFCTGASPLHLSREARVVAYWIDSMAFTCTLWFARMSILFSIIRIIPSMMRLRRTTKYVVVLFLLMWIGLIAQKTYVCGYVEVEWMNIVPLECPLGMQTGIAELIADTIADLLLIAIPVRLLWNLTLPRHHRALLISVFSASAATSVVSVFHTVFVMGPGGYLEMITAHIQASISLVVANSLVISTWLYRVLSTGEDNDELFTDSESDFAHGSVSAASRYLTQTTNPNSYDLRALSFRSSVMTVKPGPDSPVSECVPERPLEVSTIRPPSTPPHSV